MRLPHLHDTDRPASASVLTALAMTAVGSLLLWALIASVVLAII